MTRFILPIVLVATAVALFVLYIDPAFQATKKLQMQVGSYNDALDKSQEFRKLRDEKISAYNTFAPADKQKLEKILPDNVDNIRLIIDINNIAARHGLTLKNVELGTVSDSASARSALAVGASGEAVGSVELGFSVASSYDSFLAFLQDVEHSLRIVDVESISFTAPEVGSYDFTLSIRTYWLH